MAYRTDKRVGKGVVTNDAYEGLTWTE